MKSVARPLIRTLSAVATALLATTAEATLVVPVSDGRLVETSAAVVEAHVLSVDAAPAGGAPATDYLVEVDRLVHGTVPGRHLILRLPGGERPVGEGLFIEGVPRFAVGERLLLFLDPGDDGTFHPRHLMQGAFRERTVDGRRMLVRDLAGAVAVTAGDEVPGSLERFSALRDAAAFTRWVEDRARGTVRPADYFVVVAAPTAAPGARGAVTGEYRLFSQAGLNMRWFDFDQGEQVSWRIQQGGQPGYSETETAHAVRAALEAWNALAGTNIRYRYAGTTGVSGGLTARDGVNGVLFDNADGSIKTGFDCGRGGGGTLAHAGPWLAIPQTAPDGDRYYRIPEADMVMNSNIACFLDRYPRLLEQLAAHELGHTLGIHHPCDSDETSTRSCDGATTLERDALMYPFVHNDGRGARANEDDRAAARALYPGEGGGPSGPAPAAPSGLAAEVVSAHSVLATWTDNSSDETLFRLEARVAGGGWTLVATAPASSTSATIEGLAPATTYELRVQARNAHGGSPFSNVATVTTRLPVPGAPTGLAAEVTSATAVRLSWTPPAGGGQSLYRIESRTPWSPVWLVAGEAPPAATDLSLGGLDPGVPVTFRVRAVNGQGASEPSSTASVTPFAPLAACTPGEHALCLGDRFEVRAHWSSYNGGSGVGGAAAFPGGESGTFWFFKPSNIELIVKLLDGRNLNDHFWVFHGALTDVEYWISVVDTATGNSRTYYNEPRDICGQFDTRGLPGTGPATAAAPRGAATSGPEELSLMGGRFRVEVAWADHRNLGRAGTGRAVVGSDQSGYFWFFKPSNIELVVKVMDGRKVNDRFWVFFGSLSDVEYDITVTDTDTGQAKSYHNAGGSTCGQFDTAAFPF